MNRRPLPAPKVMAIDVDGTLIIGNAPRRVNESLVAEVRERINAGWDVVVWSMRGRAYAEQAADVAGIRDAVTCVGKPGLIVDDERLRWLRGCVVRGGVDKK